MAHNFWSYRFGMKSIITSQGSTGSEWIAFSDFDIFFDLRMYKRLSK